MAKTLSTDDLIRHAEGRGIRIAWHRHGPKGAWVPRDHTISLRICQDPVEERCTLAHEIGHAHYGHRPGCHPRDERKADDYAARLLVSHAEYAAAEHVYGPQPTLIAHELGVTTHLLAVWRDLYERRLRAA